MGFVASVNEDGPRARGDDAAEAFADERLIEAVLFASDAPMSVDAIAARVGRAVDVGARLSALQERYRGRGVELVRVARGWAFRTAPDLGDRLAMAAPVERKLSRAGVETLAIVAYHQPVTRAEIEQVRGVALSKGTLDALLEIGWIRPMGRKRAPGRPVMWGVTPGFLDHFGLDSLDDLPGMEELKRTGLLDSEPIFGMSAIEDEADDRQIDLFDDAAGDSGDGGDPPDA